MPAPTNNRIAWSALALAVVASGCVGDVGDATSTRGSDAATSSPADLTAPDRALADLTAPIDAAAILDLDASREDSADARIAQAIDLAGDDLIDCTKLGKMPQDPFADRVVSFQAGAYAGFGQAQLPKIVLGPPEGAGALQGSLDVVSLGDQGSIVIAFDDIGAVDGPGIDFVIFENPFVNYYEPGFVSVSEDGTTWHDFPCDPLDAANGYPGCAGVHPVFSNSQNGISPLDPKVSGGDAYDLATVGVQRARYVKIVDSGHSHYQGTTGGFDLDAVAVINGSPVACW